VQYSNTKFLNVQPIRAKNKETGLIVLKPKAIVISCAQDHIKKWH